MQVRFANIMWSSQVMCFTEYKNICSKLFPVFQHFLAFIVNFHVTTSYLTVISNKVELKVFLLLDNRYTLKDKKIKLIR